MIQSQNSKSPSGASIFINLFSTSTSVQIVSANGIRYSFSAPSTTKISVPPVRINSLTRPSFKPSTVSTSQFSSSQSKNSSVSSSTASDSGMQISAPRKVSAVSIESKPANLKTILPF